MTEEQKKPPKTKQPLEIKIEVKSAQERKRMNEEKKSGQLKETQLYLKKKFGIISSRSRKKGEKVGRPAWS